MSFKTLIQQEQKAKHIDIYKHKWNKKLIKTNEIERESE
jgi:hypothetical protein